MDFHCDVSSALARSALAVCTALFTMLLSVLLLRFLRAREHLKAFPGPSPRFLLGNLAMLVDEHGQRMPLFSLHRVLYKRYGSIVRFTMGSTPVLIISDISAMKEVLVTKWSAFRGRPDFIMPLRGTRLRAMARALVFTSSPSASGMRSSALPVFHSTSLAKASAAVADAMARLGSDVAKRCAARGGSAVPESQASSAVTDTATGTGPGDNCGAASGSGVLAAAKPFDLIPLAQRAAMAAAFERTFGIQFPDSAEPMIEAAEAFFHMTKMTDIYALMYLNLPSWTRPLLCWLSSHLNCEAARFSAGLDTTFAIVQQLTEAYAAAHPELGIDATPDKALLGAGLGKRYLEEGLTPSDDSMIANFLRTKDKKTGRLFKVADAPPFLWSFLNAAYDTTASTIAFCTFHLSRNPDVLRMLRAEISRHGPDAVPRAETLSEWPVAEACVKEVLRLHPFVLPFREANADTTVQGKPVPAGTMVQAAIGVMHRDPAHFPAPDTFRPQRFIDGLSKEAAQRYQPFGMGPRGCLGYRLAVFEAVVAVVTLHRQFDFELSTAHHPDGEIDVDMPGLMRPTHGIWVTANPYTPAPQRDPREQMQHTQHAQHTEPVQHEEQETPFCTAPLPQPAQHAAHSAHKSPFLAMPAPQGLFSGKQHVPVLRREQHSMHRSISGHGMSRSFSGHRG